MASKDYDQNDNEYKDNAGAAAVERAEESSRAQEEFQAQLAKSRRTAELEREQEILKKQQDARDLRQSKKQEQQQNERELAGKAYGFTPLNPKGSKADIEKASFEAAENRRMWQELEEKKEVKRPHGPGGKPSPAVDITNRMFDTLASAGGAVKSNVKKHVQASYSDIFKVPFQPRENIGTSKEIKPSRQKNPYASSIFGSIAKPRGATPKGLLSLGSFAGAPSQLFAVKKPKATAKSKRASSTRRSRPPTKTHGRSTLDDMLFF